MLSPVDNDPHLTDYVLKCIFFKNVLNENAENLVQWYIFALPGFYYLPMDKPC